MKHRLTVVQTGPGKVCIVSDAQLRMLQFVERHPGAFYGEVAAHIGFDCPSVTAYASRMERAGLIKRRHRRIDGRIYSTLTLAKGVRLGLDVVRV